MPGGSTLGHISLTHVSVPTADIGLAQLAMHSACESAAVSDAMALEKAMEVYYSSALEMTEKGFSLKLKYLPPRFRGGMFFEQKRHTKYPICSGNYRHLALLRE